MAKISQESLRGELVVMCDVASFLPPHSRVQAYVHAFKHSRTHGPTLPPSPSVASLTHRILGLPLRGMYNLGMISDKALQAVVLWLNGRYCTAAAAAAAAAVAALLGRTPSPATAPATANPDPGRPQGRPTRKHSRLYSPPSSPQANP
jgi:hypothetical protein